MKSENKIYIAQISTPLGLMVVASIKGGICLLDFVNSKTLKTELDHLKKEFQGKIIRTENLQIKKLKIQLNEYFLGKRKKFAVPLVIMGSDFQKKSWGALQDIPYGETRSYKEQAAAIGNLKAVRAVAKANSQNRISIVIPCHRVIGTDGRLVGYAGGLWRKKYLLGLEGLGLK